MCVTAKCHSFIWSNIISPPWWNMRLYCWLVSDYHSVGWSACDCHSPTVAILPTGQKIVFHFNLTVIWFSACVFAGGFLSVATKEHLRIPCRFLRKPHGCRSGFGSQSRSSLWVKRSYFSFSFSLAVSGTTLVPSCTVLDATLVIPACLPSSPWGITVLSAMCVPTGPDPRR